MSTINVNNISPESGTIIAIDGDLTANKISPTTGTDLTIGDLGDTVSISATTVGVRSSGTSTPTYDFNTLGEGLWSRYWDNSGARTADIVAIGNTPAGATQTMRFLTNTGSSPGTAVERMSIDSSGNLKFNSGYGSAATAYGCRAWVNFLGSGTVAIRGSGNVSSITDNGTGDYTMNFSTSMPDVNYAVAGACNEPSGSQRVFHVTGYQTSDIKIYTLDQNSGKQDADYVNAVAVR